MFKKYRELRGYTQLELAELVDKDVRTIQRIENNETVPTLESFKKLVKALKIEDKDILNYIKEKK